MTHAAATVGGGCTWRGLVRCGRRQDVRHWICARDNTHAGEGERGRCAAAPRIRGVAARGAHAAARVGGGCTWQGLVRCGRRQSWICARAARTQVRASAAGARRLRSGAWRLAWRTPASGRQRWPSRGVGVGRGWWRRSGYVGDGIAEGGGKPWRPESARRHPSPSIATAKGARRRRASFPLHARAAQRIPARWRA